MSRKMLILSHAYWVKIFKNSEFSWRFLLKFLGSRSVSSKTWRQTNQNNHGQTEFPTHQRRIEVRSSIFGIGLYSPKRCGSMLSLRYYVTKVCIITIISSLVSHFLKLSFSHVFVCFCLQKWNVYAYGSQSWKILFSHVWTT